MKISIPGEVKYILNKLEENKFEAYIVGGCVRDSILGLIPNDYDITTNAKPAEIKRIFSTDTTITTGEKYGTVTVVLSRTNYEITTYREDGNYSDGRRPDTVIFSTTLAEDLARRDFTINAMAYNEKNGLIDLFGGVNDLSSRIIRTVWNPIDRFTEDTLRIMRAIRFATTLGFSISPNTWGAIKNLKGMLKNVSAERINSELSKILLRVDMNTSIYFREIITEIIPEFIPCVNYNQNNKYHNLTLDNHILKAVATSNESLLVRLTLLLHDIGKPSCATIGEDGMSHFYNHAEASVDIARKVLTRLKFSNSIINDVLILIKNHDRVVDGSIKSVKKLLAIITPRLFSAFVYVRLSDILAQDEKYFEERHKRIGEICKSNIIIQEKKLCFTLASLNINGEDLIDCGYKGKEIGIMLQKLLSEVIDETIENTKDALLSYVRQIKNIEV